VLRDRTTDVVPDDRHGCLDAERADEAQHPGGEVGDGRGLLRELSLRATESGQIHGDRPETCSSEIVQDRKKDPAPVSSVQHQDDRAVAGGQVACRRAVDVHGRALLIVQ
jgi:hypothetical protein